MDEEDRADRIFCSSAWMYRQGVLVLSLLRQDHPVLAHNAFQAVRQHLEMWPDAVKMLLMDAYREGRGFARKL